MRYSLSNEYCNTDCIAHCSDIFLSKTNLSAKKLIISAIYHSLGQFLTSLECFLAPQNDRIQFQFYFQNISHYAHRRNLNRVRFFHIRHHSPNSYLSTRKNDEICGSSIGIHWSHCSFLCWHEVCKKLLVFKNGWHRWYGKYFFLKKNFCWRKEHSFIGCFSWILQYTCCRSDCCWPRPYFEGPWPIHSVRSNWWGFCQITRWYRRGTSEGYSQAHQYTHISRCAWQSLGWDSSYFGWKEGQDSQRSRGEHFRQRWGR